MIWIDTINVQCPDSAGVKIERQVVQKYYNIYNRDSVYITKTIIKTVEDQTHEIENRNLQKERDKFIKKYQNWLVAFLIMFTLTLIELIILILVIKNKKI